MIRLQTVLMVAGLVLATASDGIASDTGTFRVPLLKTPPVINGVLSPGEWQNAVGFDGMTWQNKLEERAGRCFVAATETDFYFAISSELPADGGKLLAKVDKNTTKTVFDDAFEVWIDANPGEERGQLFQMLGNSIGKGAYEVHTRGGGEALPEWDGKYEVAHGFTTNRWITEVRVPVSSISADRKTTDGDWGIALCRDWKQPWKFSSAPGGFKGSDTRFRFVPGNALAVQLRQVSDPFTRNIHVMLLLHNPGTVPIAVKANLDLERNSMPTMVNSRDIEIAPGATETIEFKHKEDNSDGFALSARVVSTDGSVTHYDRLVRWGQPRKRRWDTTKLITRPIDFQFAHYPYQRKLRITADISGLKKDAKLTSLTFDIHKQGTSQSVSTVHFESFPDNTIEKTVDLLELDGAYEIAMTANGINVPTDPLIKTFVRKRYEWEHNNLGKSTTVYPPFTPIEVEGRTLRTVLREHRLNDLGLWDGVTATGKQMLARPMTFTAVVAGAPASIQASPLSFVQTAPNTVVTEGHFTAGALSAVGRGTWDYDGTLKYELDLLSSGGNAVDSLVLEIPLANAVAPQMHAMKEGIRRGPVSITLPQGNGVIWDSSKLPEGDMPNGFCSYVFLGSALRGLCWFAENDLNWGWDRKGPAVEVIRKDDVLTLRVNLINTPTTIEKPRRITFGLLVAPIKPRPEAWRTFWYDNRCTVLGTCINWLGGPGDASNIYPAGKNMYFWEMIARGNVEQVSREEMKACIDRGRKYFEPYGKGETWGRHVYHNVGGSRRDKWMIFYYNRATFSACEEYATFMNEWVVTDNPAHDFKPSVGEIKLVPTESYCDFALYWYAKSFEIGRNKGVYWDNWYIRPSFNRVMTDAYEEKGEVIPAAGIWGMRELAKRTFVMMNEKGMVPITMPHMTSTNILPMHSFATVQYDWEWKYSTGDVQYRHSRDYLQLVSNGELAGVIPVLLGEHGEQAKDEWTQRTFCGAALVHELMGSGQGNVWKTLREPITQTAHDPNLKVWRYWDETPQPVSFGHPDLPVIVYAIPGKETRVVLCSYAGNDVTDARLTIDAAALGLSEPLSVANSETGMMYPVTDDSITLDVAKHEVIGFLIRGGEE